MTSRRDAPVTVLLVDDHPVVRVGYRRVLEHDRTLTVVGEAANASEALCCDRELTPDVVVLDLVLPSVGGIETLRRLCRQRPAARILMFSMYDDGIYASRSLKEGALGYLSKASAPELLVTAVRAVAQGRQYISPDVRRGMAEFAPDACDPLSPREREVLLLLSRGCDAKQIGAHLEVSVKTVANLQSAVKQKVGARTAYQLVVMARRLGLE